MSIFQKLLAFAWLLIGIWIAINPWILVAKRLNRAPIPAMIKFYLQLLVFSFLIAAFAGAYAGFRSL